MPSTNGLTTIAQRSLTETETLQNIAAGFGVLARLVGDKRALWVALNRPRGSVHLMCALSRVVESRSLWASMRQCVDRRRAQRRPDQAGASRRAMLVSGLNRGRRAAAPSAPVSVHGEARVLVRHALFGGVTERKGVTARWGPKQWEPRDQSVAKANSMRPCARGQPATEWRSLDAWRVRERHGRPVELRGRVRKREQDAQGGWRRNDLEGVHVKRGELAGRAKAVFMLVVRSPRAGELE